MTPRTSQAPTPLQPLVLEQALLLAPQRAKAADEAPDGPVPSQLEARAVPAARELTRPAAHATLPAQAAAAEKRGARPPLCGRRWTRWPGTSGGGRSTWATRGGGRGGSRSAAGWWRGRASRGSGGGGSRRGRAGGWRGPTAGR